MTPPDEAFPVLLLGAGRLGGALLDGWRAAGLPAAKLMVRCPSPKPATEAAAAEGARINPPDEALAAARTVLLAVKPQVWRAVAAEAAPLLGSDAVVLSVAAGVSLADLAAGFGGRRVGRVMPTTGVAIARGVAAVHAPDPAVRARAHALFDPVATTADLPEEAMMEAAGAVVGSGPAYLYAFTEALERAGTAAGLPPGSAAVLARATMESAAALMAAGDDSPAELRRQVASPGGITEAALRVLDGESGLEALLVRALAANMARSRELA